MAKPLLRHEHIAIRAAMSLRSKWYRMKYAISKTFLRVGLGAMAPFLGRERRFTAHYIGNVWNDSESFSGPGSRRDSQCVKDALEQLSAVTMQFGIRSVADIPCGDFNWISAFLAAHPEVDYIGYDIVAQLIERNRREFPLRQFAKLDIVAEIPPPADLILCKDLFNHLRFDDVARAIANMRASRTKYLLASNNFGYANRELWRIPWLRSRHLDLTKAPLHYPPPICKTHYLGLWFLQDMKPQTQLATAGQPSQ